MWLQIEAQMGKEGKKLTFFHGEIDYAGPHPSEIADSINLKYGKE